MSSFHSSDPIWRKKKRIKGGQFSPAPEPFLFTVNISHMRRLDRGVAVHYKIEYLSFLQMSVQTVQPFQHPAMVQ